MNTNTNTNTNHNTNTNTRTNTNTNTATNTNSNTNTNKNTNANTSTITITSANLFESPKRNLIDTFGLLTAHDQYLLGCCTQHVLGSDRASTLQSLGWAPAG